MKLISVAGASSRAGKTAAAVTVLQALGPGAASAVKFTTTEDVFERCPRGTPCVVCDIDVPFRIVEDVAVLRQPGTDTDRLSAAGARRVVWAISKAGAAAEAWAAVIRRLGDEATVVIEGSRVVGLARPDHLVFVAHAFLAPERWKATSGPLLAEADLAVMNRPTDEPREPSPFVVAAFERYRKGREARIADVTRPLAEWAPDFLARIRTPALAHA